MTRMSRQTLERYGVAILACAAALGLQLLMPAVFLRQAPLLPYLLAVFVSAWTGGWGPGLLATLFSTEALLTPLLLSEAPAGGSRGAALVAVMAFTTIALGMSALAGRLRQVNTRLHEERERLHKSNEFHAAIAGLGADFAFSAGVREDGTVAIEEVTEGFQRLLGWSPEDMVTRGGWATFIHPDDVPQAQADLARLLRGQTVEGELRWIAHDGRVLGLRHRTRPIVDEDGRIAPDQVIGPK